MSNDQTIPGSIIGYRKDGRPIYLIAGGSEENGDGNTGEPNGQPTGDGGDGGTGEPPAGDPPAGDPPAGDGQPSEDELPEHWRKELKTARADAARYRTSLREAEAKLAEAKTPADIEAAVQEFRNRNAELEREVLVTKVARKYDLPDELAARLQGKDESELEADAKALQKFAAPAAPDHLSGGLNPGAVDDEPNDPAELARRYGRGRNKRPA